MNDFTEFAPSTGMDMESIRSQGFGMVKYGVGDDRKLVLFYNKAVLNPRKSQEEGRPYHENKVYVKIGEPGETNLNLIDRPVQESDKQRWPRQWMQFVNNQKQVPDGTPVEMLFPTNPAIAATLKSFGVHTIEQLGHLSAEGITRVGMGAQEWVNKAKAYIEKAEKGVSYHKFEEALAQRDNEIAVLKNSINMLRGQLEAALTKPMRAAPAAPQEPDFDVQESMINAASVDQRIPNYELPPTAFTNDIATQPKRRGRPPKQKETA